MAKAATKTKTAPKGPEAEADMPEGFKPLGRSKVSGWFAREVGNKVQGILKDSFTVKSKQPRFPDKKVYVIEITAGETTVFDSEGNPQTIDAGTVGIDETGYLKKLGTVEVGTEVWIKCKGKDGEAKDAPWIFAVAVMPF